MQRVVKTHWVCPNCETVNPDYADFCEVCMMEQTSAALIVEKTKKEGRITLSGTYTKPSWEIPGNIKIKEVSKIPVYKPTKPVKFVDEKTWGPMAPAGKVYNKFLTLPAKSKKRWLVGGAVAGGILINVAFSGGMLILYLLAMGWLFMNYRYGASFRKRADHWLDPDYKEMEGYREEVKYLDKYEDGHNASIIGLAFSATGDQLVSVDKNGIMIRWDLELGEKRKRRKLLEPGFFNMVIGKTSAYAREFNQVKAYRPDGSLKGTMKVPIPAAPENELVISREQNMLALGSNLGDIILWNTRNFTQKILNSDVKERVTGIDFFSGEKYVVSGNERGGVMVWELMRGSVIFMDVRSGVYVTGVAASHTGSHFAAAYSDGEIRVFSFANFKEARRFNIREHIEGGDSNQYAKLIQFLPTRDILVTSDQHGLVQLWGWRGTGEEELVKNYAGRSGRLRAMAISQAGRWIAVGGDDGIISMFDLSGRSRLIGS